MVIFQFAMLDYQRVCCFHVVTIPYTDAEERHQRHHEGGYWLSTFSQNFLQ